MKSISKVANISSPSSHHHRPALVSIMPNNSTRLSVPTAKIPNTNAIKMYISDQGSDDVDASSGSSSRPRTKVLAGPVCDVMPLTRWR